MRAALALLSATPVKDAGRRIAVLGDMLELGPTSPELHAGLADSIVDHAINTVFLAGPDMKFLQESLAKRVDCVHTATIDELIPHVRRQLRGGDAIMVKASLGMKFARLVDELLITASSPAASSSGQN